MSSILFKNRSGLLNFVTTALLRQDDTNTSFNISNLRIHNFWKKECTNLFHCSLTANVHPKLTPQEVTDILRANEYTHEFQEDDTCCIRSFDNNQLASNSPAEDARSEANCTLTGGTLVGVFDGHGGAACAQVIAKRLFRYICVSLLPEDLLRKYLSSLEHETDSIQLMKCFNDNYELVSELKGLYSRSFTNYVKSLVSDRKDNFSMENALKHAFLTLDNDISQEALDTNKDEVNLQTISVALSGSVACVAHIDGPHLHIANVGDCQAVLGILTDENAWIAKKLTVDHNTENIAEVKRIHSEHPASEKDTVIRMDRLLGQLAPLRAFGDVRYKWGVDILNKIVIPYFGDEMIAPGYYTPPYLTACPEISYHRLTPRDKFLIIATDGLWDFMTATQAVQLVGEHMCGKVTLSPFKLPRPDMQLGEIYELLQQRREGLNMKPIDRNAATHLFRNALGSTEYGIEHGKISSMLTLPQEVVRLFRDDMTVTVVYFNSDFLREFHH